MCKRTSCGSSLKMSAKGVNERLIMPHYCAVRQYKITVLTTTKAPLKLIKNTIILFSRVKLWLVKLKTRSGEGRKSKIFGYNLTQLSPTQPNLT